MDLLARVSTKIPLDCEHPMWGCLRSTLQKPLTHKRDNVACFVLGALWVLGQVTLSAALEEAQRG